MSSNFVKHKKDMKFDGVGFYDYVEKLNSNLKTEEERINLVESLLYDEDGSIIDYLIKAMTGESGGKLYTDVVLNKSDNLSSDNTLFKMIEMMATYIINAPSAERLIYMQEYKFYRDRDKFKKAVHRESVDNFTSQEQINTHGVNKVIDFLLVENKNFKKSMDDEIKSRDIREIEPIAELDFSINKLKLKRDRLKSEKNKIENLVEHALEEELEELRVKSRQISKDVKKIENVIGGMRKDQLLIKEAFVKPLRFKSPLPDTFSRPDWSQFDFFDETQVEALLYTSRNTSYSDERQDLVDNLSKYIKAAKFNPLDTEILHGLHTGERIGNIAIRTDQARRTITRRISLIVKEIVKQHELFYSDWYYTHVVKGKYKKCLICGENVHEHRIKDDVCHYCRAVSKKACVTCGEPKKFEDFGFKKSNRDGHKNICKDCEKESRQKVLKSEELEKMIADFDFGDGNK